MKKIWILMLGAVMVGVGVLVLLYYFYPQNKKKYTPLVVYRDNTTEIAFYKCNVVKDITGRIKMIEGKIESCYEIERTCIIKPTNYCQSKFGKITFGLVMSRVTQTFDQAGNGQPAIYDSKFYYINKNTGKEKFSGFLTDTNASELIDRVKGKVVIVSFDFLDNIYFIDNSLSHPVANSIYVLED